MNETAALHVAFARIELTMMSTVPSSWKFHPLAVRYVTIIQWRDDERVKVSSTTAWLFARIIRYHGVAATPTSKLACRELIRILEATADIAILFSLSKIYPLPEYCSRCLALCERTSSTCFAVLLCTWRNSAAASSWFRKRSDVCPLAPSHSRRSIFLSDHRRKLIRFRRLSPPRDFLVFPAPWKQA